METLTRHMVWVVDDDHEYRDAMLALLSARGYDPIGFEDGAAAWGALESDGTKPRVILLDKEMPSMDGIEFRARQMADPRVSDVPVIMLMGAGGWVLPGALVMQKSAGCEALLGILRTLFASVAPPATSDGETLNAAHPDPFPRPNRAQSGGDGRGRVGFTRRSPAFRSG